MVVATSPRLCTIRDHIEAAQERVDRGRATREIEGEDTARTTRVEPLREGVIGMVRERRMVDGGNRRFSREKRGGRRERSRYGAPCAVRAYGARAGRATTRSAGSSLHGARGSRESRRSGLRARNDAGSDIAVPSDVLPDAVQYEVNAVLERPHERGRGESRIDDRGRPVSAAERRQRREIRDVNERVRQRLKIEHRGALALERFFNRRKVALVDGDDANPKF